AGRTWRNAPALLLIRWCGSASPLCKRYRAGGRWTEGRGELLEARRGFLPSAADGRTPTLMVGFARLLAIRGRTDLDAHFQLLVTFNGGLLRAAVFLAPDQRQLGAWLCVLLFDEAERQHLALVEAVAGEHRGTDGLAAAHDGVERARSIV